jgi:hypothetical protein
MSKQQSFITKEAREQKALIWFIGNNANITSCTPMPKFSSFDNWMTSGGTEFMVEVKVRTDYTSEQINRFGGAYIEFDKLAGILEFQDKNNLSSRIIYANFFKDEVQMFELDPNPASYTWELKYLQKNDYDKQKVWKQVACLPQSNIIERRTYK